MIAFESFSFAAVGFFAHGNIVISKPAGTVEGDLLLFTANDDRGSGRTFAGILPAGWTLVNEFQHVSSGATSALAFKIAGSSEPSSYTFQVLPSAKSATISAIMRFSGTVGFPANPIDAFATASIRAFVPSPFDTTIPSATVVMGDARILRVLVCRNAPQPYGDGLFSYQSGPAATEIMDKGTGNAGNRAGFGAYLQDAAVGAGATGISTIRFSHSQTIATNYDRWMWTIALVETPVSGGGEAGGGPFNFLNQAFRNWCELGVCNR